MLGMIYHDVNDAFDDLTKKFKKRELPVFRKETRNGMATVLIPPIGVSYMKPWNNILLRRDGESNPFFNLYEAIWMIAGRNDVESVNHFVRRFEDFSDDGITLNGAYGHRWRTHFGFDQIEYIINKLKTDKINDRRLVLSIWDGQDDLRFKTKDRPCNLQVLFKIVDKSTNGTLNMTVMNRSNDLVWGLLGANAYNMAFLHSYISARTGLDQGVYTQISNNLHAYDFNFNYDEWKRSDYVNYEGSDQGNPLLGSVDLNHIGGNPFMEDCNHLINMCPNFPEGYSFHTPFFRNTVFPMMLAWRMHKEGLTENALELLTGIRLRIDMAPRMTRAGVNWLREKIAK